jgi:iron complex transport system ATP-binding protein
MAKEDESAMMLEGVSFEVSGKVLLQPLTLGFAERGVMGLVGPNGSGKSTLLRILARQQTPTRGRISLAGRPLPAWGEREFAQRVAYLPQHLPLATGLTVGELVGLGRYPWHGALGRITRTDREKVEEALTLTATDTLADRLVDTLSGGERQRVWLAMLIAQDARLLLLDEPISALDVAHQIEVLGLIRRLSLDSGIAAIVVIHEINMAARFCDEILALKGGRMIVRGPPAEFMVPSRLEEIYDVPIGVLPHPDADGAIAFVRA